MVTRIEPKAGDVIKRISTGEIRIAMGVCDNGRWEDIKGAQRGVRQWVTQAQLVATSESRWTPSSEWEIVFPGHGWAEAEVRKGKTQKELDEREGGATGVAYRTSGEGTDGVVILP